MLANACRSPGAAASPEEAESELRVVAVLKRIVDDAAQASADVRVAVAPVAPAAAAAAAALPELPAQRADVSVAAADTVRVSTQKLNAILLKAEELVGAKIAAAARSAELRELAADLARSNQKSVGVESRRRDVDTLDRKRLEQTLRKLSRAAHQDALALAALTDGILEDTKKVLLLPCSYLLASQPRMLRDLARDLGKDAELRVAGEDIEIDRRVLDELRDPMTHLLRNAVDHGIETPDRRREAGKPERALVTITVTPAEGNRVEIVVSDDGIGIDRAKVRNAAVRSGIVTAGDQTESADAEVANLIFHSGLSTSPMITDVSGRGLGLAIVREKVEKLGGTISVSSQPGSGTTFRLLVPLHVATFRGVSVDVAGQRFMIPSFSVERVIRVASDDIKSVENRQTIAVGPLAVSLVRLRDILELSGPERQAAGTAQPVVVVRSGDRRIGLLVDEIHGEQEVVVKPLGSLLTRVRNIAGASISGGGAVVPILNVSDLVASVTRHGATRSTAFGQTDHSEPSRRHRVLVAEDSITSRSLLKRLLEDAGYEVVATVDGLDALTTLRADAFDLVVSDVDMPNMNGFELTIKIRADKALGELPVVLVTSLGSARDRAYGIEVGASAYIAKSDFDQGSLLETIRRLL